jgi:hypothetical protein
MKKPSCPVFPVVVLLLTAVLGGCAKKESGITVIWTDQAEFASYTELFNTSQSKYRVVLQYKENPADALITAKHMPDIVIGPWLKGEKTRFRMIPIDYLFNELRINSKLFYGPLLELGNIRGRQYLLPVSFNLPALIFSTDKQLLISNDFSLSLSQVNSLSREFNAQKKGTYSRMGFSPRWDTEFLYLTTLLFNAKYEEDTPLFKWNDAALKDAIKYMRSWTKTINTSTTAEDDFKFKYLYDPPYKLVTGNKTLFSYIASDDLFVLPHDKIRNIDFRWITKENRTPVNDGIIYLGICTKAPNLEAAEAFLSWFFTERTQKELLSRAQTMGTMERTFGISGGFSSLKSVNEKIFPLLYPSLLGHLPPSDALTVPHILPNNWEMLKKEILIPYLIDAVSAPEGQEEAVISLEDRIASWVKTH